MSSSSSNFIVIILLIIAAFFIITANEANHGFLKTGKDLKHEGGKIIENFIGKFSKDKTSTESEAAPEKKAISRKIKKSVDLDKQEDELAHRDREELNDLIEKVGK